MHLFKYRKDELFAEDVSARELVKKYGTPLYVYSYNTLLRHFKAYTDAFKNYPHIVCFALKANPNTAILRLFAKNGGGADIVSGGELYKALKAGISPQKIVYAGVGKKEEEIIFALRSNILMFNVESKDELKEINRIAGIMKRKAPIALRINPDIDPETHPYIATGLKEHKFGIPIEDALEYYRVASMLKNIKVVGIHKHIGSQITKVSPFVDALRSILLFVDKLSSEGLNLQYFDVGGGLGIPYKNEEPPLPKELAKSFIPLLRGKGLTIIIEPGRSIAGNAGILLTKVLYIKKAGKKDFMIVDAGMNDLIRPSLYNAYHQLLPIMKKRRHTALYDVVGPICESSDFLAKERRLKKVKQGEYLAVMSAGAYGSSMSSNYNSRPRAAEVMVKCKEHFLIKSREAYSDLSRNEKIPRFLQ